MIDLHMHSKYSDGTCSVKELLKMAEDLNLEYISITDHNTCKAYEELKTMDYKKYFSGKIIRGVELNTSVGGFNIELLGYGIEPEKLQEKLEKIYITQKEINELEKEQLVKKCESLGIVLDDPEMKKFNEQVHKYYSVYLLEQIRKEAGNRKYFTCDEAWEDAMVFYRKEMCNKKSKFYLDSTKFYPSMQETINLIRKAGGLVFVPHIYIYGENSPIIFQEIVNNYDVEGFECYYSKFTEEQTRSILKYCKENNYYISGGSDFHGSIKPKIKMGTGMGNLSISSDILSPYLSLIS